MGRTVGVIVPARNAADTIETCLTTITDQTHPDRGAYVVDDASTDGMGAFLAERPGWYRGIAHHETRRGWPAALNAAADLAIADGADTLVVMNADDLLRLDAVEHLCDALDDGTDIAVPMVQQIGGANVVQRSVVPETAADFATHTPLVSFCALGADTWRALGGYALDVNLPGILAGHNELDFYYRAWRDGLSITVLDHLSPLVYYRVHPGQLSTAVVARHDEALALIHAKHPELRQYILSSWTQSGTTQG